MNLLPGAQEAVEDSLNGMAPLDGAPYAPVVLSRVDPSGIVEHRPLAVTEAYADAVHWLDGEFSRAIDPSLKIAAKDLGDIRALSVSTSTDPLSLDLRLGTRGTA